MSNTQNTPRQISLTKAHAVMADLYRARIAAILEGPPGCGKTSICGQLAAHLDAALMTVHPAISDRCDLAGQPAVITQDGRTLATHLPYDDLRQLLAPDGPTVCLLDDVGQAPSYVQPAIQQLVLARRIGQHHVDAQVWFCLATNTRADHGSGSIDLLSTLRNRCATLRVKPTIQEWRRYAAQRAMHPLVLVHSYLFPQTWEDAANTTPGTDPFYTPRSADLLSEVLKTRPAWKNSEVRTRAEALVGAQAAAEISSITRYWEQWQYHAESLQTHHDPATVDKALAVLTHHGPELEYMTAVCLGELAREYPELNKHITDGNAADRLTGEPRQTLLAIAKYAAPKDEGNPTEDEDNEE